jgi:hypothetical protein
LGTDFRHTNFDFKRRFAHTGVTLYPYRTEAQAVVIFTAIVACEIIAFGGRETSKKFLMLWPRIGGHSESVNFPGDEKFQKRLNALGNQGSVRMLLVIPFSGTVWWVHSSEI